MLLPMDGLPSAVAQDLVTGTLRVKFQEDRLCELPSFPWGQVCGTAVFLGTSRRHVGGLFGLLGIAIDFVDGLLQSLEAGSVSRVYIPAQYHEVIPNNLCMKEMRHHSETGDPSPSYLREGLLLQL